MTAIDRTKTTIDALDRSPFPSPTPKRDEIDVADTLRLRMYSSPTKPEAVLRDAPERHDGQLPSPSPLLDV
jgi:hypothetical protein